MESIDEYDIHLAIINNNLDYIKDHPEEYNKRNCFTNMPLHRACIVKNIEAIKILVESKFIDINAINLNGETALHCIAKRYESESDLSIIKYLIDHGADKHIKNNKGITPKDLFFSSCVISNQTIKEI